MPTVIASRTIDLARSSGSPVQVSIMRPEPDGNDYRCEFQIVGLGEKTINSYGMGVDSTQALVLTLQQIGTHDRLSAMERLATPRFDLPGVGRDRLPETAVMDGADYRLWTAFGVYERPRRADGGVELSGNVDTQFADWGEQLLASLATCWRSEP